MGALHAESVTHRQLGGSYGRVQAAAAAEGTADEVAASTKIQARHRGKASHKQVGDTPSPPRGLCSRPFLRPFHGEDTGLPVAFRRLSTALPSAFRRLLTAFPLISRRLFAAAALLQPAAARDSSNSRLLEWSHEWYRSTRGVLITLGDPRGAAMPDTEDELGAEAAG